MDKNPNELRYRMRVSLMGMESSIWRQIETPGSLTLGDFHVVLQVVMGWHDVHLHSFTVGKGRSARTYSQVQNVLLDIYDSGDLDEESVILAEILPRKGSWFTYLYDYGDSWEHEIRVEKRWHERGTALTIRCLDGRGACPPEDSGGVWGYQDKLEMLANPKAPDTDGIREWMGEGFDPEAFSVDQVNQMLVPLNNSLNNPP